MKKLVFIFCLSLPFFFGNCKSNYVKMNDVECLKIINPIVSAEFEKELGSEYDLIKKNIKFIMKFYMKENGKADSIVVGKSNLVEMGINEKLIINNLMKNRYQCIRDVYYSNKLKPDYVTVIFNPNLINPK